MVQSSNNAMSLQLRPRPQRVASICPTEQIAPRFDGLSRTDTGFPAPLPLTFPTSAADISAHFVPGIGRPVLFIHGNSSCKEIWRYQLQELALSGRPALAPDLPGHGMSSDARTPETTYSFTGYAAALEEVLQQLGWDSVDVVGWSLGGHIGLELYATSRRVKSLLVVGTPPVRPAPKALELGFYQTEDMQLTGKSHFSHADARTYATRMLGGEHLVTGDLFDGVLRTDGKARHFMIKNTLAGTGVDARRAVQTIDKPLCVVHGEEEPFVRIDYLRSLNYRRLWNGRIYVIASSGHAPHWQYPREFNGILISFLGLTNTRDFNITNHGFALA